MHWETQATPGGEHYNYELDIIEYDGDRSAPSTLFYRTSIVLSQERNGLDMGHIKIMCLKNRKLNPRLNSFMVNNLFYIYRVSPGGHIVFCALQ